METVTKAEQISNIAFGFMASKALFVALHCNIFTNLSGNPKNAKTLAQELILGVSRRGKYILVQTTSGTLLIHLGMSGKLQILQEAPTAAKHDHVDIILSNGYCLRYNDPRRFGSILWTKSDPLNHKLLKKQ